MQRYLLIADGCGTMAKRIQSYFSPRGYRADVVTDGLECLARLKVSRPDVLILDKDLPWGGADGILAWMRDGSIRSKIPVVLMTDQDNARDDRFPIRSCLYRPFDVTDLFEAVSYAIRPSQTETTGTRRREAFPVLAGQIG